MHFDDPLGNGQRVTEVWAWNFDVEFEHLLAATSRGQESVVLALDTEFPGFLREESQTASRARRYQALRDNVDNTRPIQLGLATATTNGSFLGTWSFNLHFDVGRDLHSEESINFLRAAGVQFDRHAAEGIDPMVFGRRLAKSFLVGRNGSRPQWVTFQGWYDFAYFYKMLTSWPLPRDEASFENALSVFCPRRRELRDDFPRGSLDSLIREFGIERVGTPHTAGSDALATLELHLHLELHQEEPQPEETLEDLHVETPWNMESVKGDWRSSYNPDNEYWDTFGGNFMEESWGGQNMNYQSNPYYGQTQQQVLIQSMESNHLRQPRQQIQLRSHIQASTQPFQPPEPVPIPVQPPEASVRPFQPPQVVNSPPFQPQRVVQSVSPMGGYGGYRADSWDWSTSSASESEVHSNPWALAEASALSPQQHASEASTRQPPMAIYVLPWPVAAAVQAG